MITDIEMNGTIRGAVEVYNLASHLRDGDALFAESIRTFSTRDVDARAWLHRLALEVQAVKVQISSCVVIPRPLVGGWRGKCWEIAKSLKWFGELV